MIGEFISNEMASGWVNSTVAVTRVTTRTHTGYTFFVNFSVREIRGHFLLRFTGLNEFVDRLRRDKITMDG